MSWRFEWSWRALDRLLRDPLWRRLDLRRRLMSRVFSSAAGQAADRPDLHVVIAEHLAAQPNTRQAARREHVSFGGGHTIGFAANELDAAGRATRVAAASVELIDPGILLEG